MTRIDTTEYEFSHGKLPRGTGSWAFMFGRNGAWTTEFTPHQMTYTAACKWARQQAKALGCDQISVGS